MSHEQSTVTPVIRPREDASLRVDDLQHLIDAEGNPISTADRGKGNIALCRCGASGSKPFCDGTHKKTDFRSARLSDGDRDVRDSYAAEGVTVHDNREGAPTITINAAGPYFVTGGVELDIDEDAWLAGASRERYALCRCGHSKNKPFCDGTHGHVGFDDPGLELRTSQKHRSGPGSAPPPE